MLTNKQVFGGGVQVNKRDALMRVYRLGPIRLHAMCMVTYVPHTHSIAYTPCVPAIQ